MEEEKEEVISGDLPLQYKQLITNDNEIIWIRILGKSELFEFYDSEFPETHEYYFSCFSVKDIITWNMNYLKFFNDAETFITCYNVASFFQLNEYMDNCEFYTRITFEENEEEINELLKYVHINLPEYVQKYNMDDYLRLSHIIKDDNHFWFIKYYDKVPNNILSIKYLASFCCEHNNYKLLLVMINKLSTIVDDENKIKRYIYRLVNLSIKFGHKNIILSLKDDFNLIYDMNVVISAINYNQIELVKHFIDKERIFESIEQNLSDCYYSSVIYDNNDTFKLLLDRNIEIDTDSNSTRFILHLIYINDSVKCFKLFVDNINRFPNIPYDDDYIFGEITNDNKILKTCKICLKFIHIKSEEGDLESIQFMFETINRYKNDDNINNSHDLENRLEECIGNSLLIAIKHNHIHIVEYILSFTKMSYYIHKIEKFKYIGNNKFDSDIGCELMPELILASIENNNKSILRVLYTHINKFTFIDLYSSTNTVDIDIDSNIDSNTDPNVFDKGYRDFYTIYSMKMIRQLVDNKQFEIFKLLFQIDELFTQFVKTNKIKIINWLIEDKQNINIARIIDSFT